jgi:O-antigen ligase
VTAHRLLRIADGAVFSILLGAAAGLAACAGTVERAAFIVVLCAALVAWYAFTSTHGWINVLFAAALLLPPLPIAWGDSGPHIAAGVAAVGALSVLARAGQWRIRLTFLDVSMLSLFAVLLWSIGFAAIHSGALIAVNSAVRVLLFGISLLVFFSVSQGPDRQIPSARERTLRLLFWIAFASAAFGCVDFWYQLPAPAGYGAQYIWLDSGVYRRAQGLFYESSTLGTFCSFWTIMVAVALSDRVIRQRIGVLALCLAGVTFGLGLLLSFSRSAVGASAVALCTLAILERRRWFTARVLIAGGVGIAVTIGVFAVIFPEFAAGYWARFNFTFADALSRPDRVLSGRLENWRTLAAFIGAHAWQALLGIGYKTLPYTDHLGTPLIADNMYLSIFVETGLAGLLSLIALNAAILGASWRIARNAGSFYAKWIFCFWAGFSVQMFSGDLLTYWRVLPVFFWVLAAAVQDSDARFARGSVR